jgi:hypothetical protein
VKSQSLEIVRRADGSFDVFLNRDLTESGVSGAWIEDTLCTRYGFCGDEGRAIFREGMDNGRGTIRF